MADSKIFCNIPWFEININHDGSYDLCGCQNDKIVGTPLGQTYNIKQIPIDQYWNSDRMRQARLIKLGMTPDPMCRMCQAKDATGYASNRVKENLKSVIFQDQFDRSYAQSPHLEHFEFSQAHQGLTKSKVRSLHINLGNTCNFACRMCSPVASSRLQQEFKKLGWIKPEDTFEHWTESSQGWNNFLKFLDDQGDHIKVIHVIGGEVEFMPKFQFLIEHFVERRLASTINISFTTNGSIDYQRHFPLLGQYKRCEIGVSIESIGPIGNYIRQGGDIAQILDNILKLKSISPSNTAIAIRTVPSLLSLGNYPNLIRWAWAAGIPIDNSLLVQPIWLQASLLGEHMKNQIADDLEALLNEIPDSPGYLNNQKDANRLNLSMRNECESMIKLCRSPSPIDAATLRTECARRLDQWDKSKKINLKDYDQSLYEFLNLYGYQGA